MTRYSATATMVISSEGSVVINEWINRGSVERRCIDDTRESGVVSFTREIHASRNKQRATFAEFNGRICTRNRTRSVRNDADVQENDGWNDFEFVNLVEK